MVVPLYNITDNGIHDCDPYKMYKPDSTMFSIKLHYGGVFIVSPNRKYNNANITFVDLIDSDQFSVHEIDSMLEDLGQDGHRVMSYHFLKPGCDLDNGLEPLAYQPRHIHTPKAKRLVIEELDDAEPRISKAGITPVAKKLVFNVNNKQTSEKNLEGQSSEKDLEGQSSGKDLEGKSSAVGNDGSSQVPTQFVNDFYSLYDPYEESNENVLYYAYSCY
nr:polyamine oxidase 1 [Tanacetum cinerariifolium]